MEQKERESILKNHRLRVTNCRLDVLEMFSKVDHALSQKDLEGSLQGYDRVTLYRTLQSFIDKGVLHKIPNESGVATFGICFDTCTSEDHNHNHLHFKCNQCGNIECIENQPIPKIDVPNGYKVQHWNMIVDGLCKSCA
ncbi:MAG: transcriptional repressor [Cyclobacteriaceae bacterium]